MAVVAATNTSVEILRGDDDAPAFAGESNNFRLKRAVIYGFNGATAVIGGTDTLDFVVNTLVQNSVRNGKTVTLRSASVVQAASTGAVSYAATISISTNTVSLTPKTADWSTNATVSASTLVKPFAILVSYSEA